MLLSGVRGVDITAAIAQQSTIGENVIRQPEIQSPNFGFLEAHDAQLLAYAARAERYVVSDPNTALIKLRQLAEELAELAAAYSRLYVDREDGFSDLLRRLERADVITHEMADIFHGLRKAGNAAAHDGAGSRQEAMRQLKLAYRLAVWFHRAFRDPSFRPGPFAMPPDPPKVSSALKDELDRLRKARWDSERRADATEDALAKARREQKAAEARAAGIYEELEAALELIDESEAREAALHAEHRKRVAQLQQESQEATEGAVDAIIKQASEAAREFDLSEGEAREQIDAQLRARGWEADSVVRTWDNGARPQSGRTQAIAFCPAGKGIADYILFHGLRAVGVIEAKRRNLDLCEALEEAEVHARACHADPNTPEAVGDRAIPLLFASNGRPRADGHDAMHGVWFLDRFNEDSRPRVLETWPTPSEIAEALDAATPSGK